MESRAVLLGAVVVGAAIGVWSLIKPIERPVRRPLLDRTLLRYFSVLCITMGALELLIGFTQGRMLLPDIFGFPVGSPVTAINGFNWLSYGDHKGWFAFLGGIFSYGIFFGVTGVMWLRKFREDEV